MNKRTLYFIEGDKELLEINVDYEKKHTVSPRQLFRNLLLREITTLKGRLDAIKSIFSYSYNIPVYINDDMIFFKVYGEHKLWINGANVQDIKNKNNRAVIVFKCGRVFETTSNYRTAINAFRRAAQILDYKNGLLYP